MTKEEFLIDTLEYYTTDTSRRCIQPNGNCYYNPKNAKGTKGEGCAIGRHLPEDLKQKLDTASELDGCISVNMLFGEKRFAKLLSEVPLPIKALGKDFLCQIQIFHDTGSNFSDTIGLSGFGQDSLRVIIKKYKFDESKFEKYLK